MNLQWAGAWANRVRVSGHAAVGGVVGSLALLAVGCAGMWGLTKDSPAEEKSAVVTERVKARWDTLIKGDLDASYEFLSPGSKSAFTLIAYKSRMKPPQWKSVKIDGVDCEAEVCKVSLRVTYDFTLQRGIPVRNIESLTNETWIIDKGTAWFVEPN